MENHENPASSTDIFSGDVGIGLLRRLVLTAVLFAAPGCRDEVVFAELSATRAKLEACQAENTNLKVQLARNEGTEKKGDGDKDDERRKILDEIRGENALPAPAPSSTPESQSGSASSPGPARPGLQKPPAATPAPTYNNDGTPSVPTVKPAPAVPTTPSAPPVEVLKDAREL